MPKRNQHARPQHIVDQAVKRYLAGEQATSLAKEYKISKPGFYLWVKKQKREMMEQAKTAGMSPSDAAVADKRTILIENESLRLEVRKLRERLFQLMLDTGKL